MNPSQPEPPLLVLGYGNTLRQDDQAGPLVAEMLEARELKGVRTIACAQLSPEHAQAVALSRAVVFVDAQAGGPGRVTSLRRIKAGESSQVTTHAVEPRTLLAIVRDVYGWPPPAWILTIPAERMGFGTEISQATYRGIGVAVEEIERIATADLSAERVVAFER